MITEQQIQFFEENVNQVEVHSCGELDTQGQKSLRDYMLNAIATDPDNLSAIEPHELMRQIESGYVLILMDQGKFVGFTRVLPKGKFRIISTTFVDPEYRGRQLGLKLLERAIDRFGTQNLYLETQNEYMRKIAEHLGFRALSAAEIRKYWKLIVQSNWEQMTAAPRRYFSGMLSNSKAETPANQIEYTFMLRSPEQQES